MAIRAPDGANKGFINNLNSWHHPLEPSSWDFTTTTSTYWNEYPNAPITKIVGLGGTNQTKIKKHGG